MPEQTNFNKTDEDLGLGAAVIQQNLSRFINRDGSFNVYRKGVFERGSFSPYHAVLKMSWPRFYFWIFTVYVLMNLLFSGLYLCSGPSGFPPLAGLGYAERFGKLFFYSVQVITTLGSGSLHPTTVYAEGVLALEAMVGIIGFTVIAGLMFARFSNPAVKIKFSNRAVIAPYKDITGFMFRIVNGRNNELIEVAATVTLALVDKNGRRNFHQLPLERDSVLMFPLSWTIVHPTTETSPIYAMSADDLAEANAEFLIAITAIDQDLSKKVHARFSYLHEEVTVGRKFVNILERGQDGTVFVDPSRIDQMDA